MSQPEPNVDEVVRSIAEETDTPPETVPISIRGYARFLSLARAEYERKCEQEKRAG